MIVIDASAVIDAFLGHERLAEMLATEELHAPASIDSEILHALRRAVRTRDLSEAHAEAVVEFLREAPIARHRVTPLVRRMWALRHNISAYDAAYVALAESLNLPLLTRDRHLANASGHAARIEYIA